jgi:hypothetical protein
MELVSYIAVGVGIFLPTPTPQPCIYVNIFLCFDVENLLLKFVQAL